MEAVLWEMERYRTPSEMLVEARRSPVEFWDHLLIQAGPNVVRYGESMDDWQRADLEAIVPGWRYMSRVTSACEGPRRAYLERGRGHSKTTDIAALVAWAILSSESMLWGYAAAAAEKQAMLIIKSLKVLCKLNPWLNDRLIVTDKAVKNPMTGSVCEIVAASAKTTFGETPNFVVCDELTHWYDEAIWEALFSGIAKVPDAMMIVISNAGFGRGRSWQWHLREKIRNDPAWYFKSLNGVQASWLTPEDLAEQERVLGSDEYRRLYENKWLSDSTTGIPHSQIMAATTLPGPRVDAEHDYDVILAGLDIGLTNDRTSLVIMGASFKRRTVELINHHTWRPKDYSDGRIDLADVEEVILMEHGRLGGIDAVFADQWQAARSLELLAAAGIDCHEVIFSSAKTIREMGRRFVTGFRNGTVVLYFDEVLEEDLLAIEISYSEIARTYRLTAPRDETGHADSAFAAAIVIMVASMEIEAAVGLEADEMFGAATAAFIE